MKIDADLSDFKRESVQSWDLRTIKLHVSSYILKAIYHR